MGECFRGIFGCKKRGKLSKVEKNTVKWGVVVAPRPEPLLPSLVSVILIDF